MNENMAYENGTESGMPPENTAGSVIEAGDGLADAAGDTQPVQDLTENLPDGSDEPETVPDSLVEQDAEELHLLQRQLSMVCSEEDALHECCEIYGREIDRLREERDRLTVMVLQQMGAVDGSYLLEKMRRDGVTDSEQIFKQAKSSYPQLFRRKLEGVRPAVGGTGEAVAPNEMSFSERMRQFTEDPDGYAQRFR